MSAYHLLIKMIDKAFFRRFKHVLEFVMPDATERAELWRLLLPEKVLPSALRPAPFSPLAVLEMFSD